MKKIILIVIVIALIVGFFWFQKKQKENTKNEPSNYVGVKTPSGEYGVDVDQVADVWESISGMFNQNNGKQSVNCEGLSEQERNDIASSENFKCA